MFKNPFSFNGRIRRTEFGLSVLIYDVILITFQLTVGIEYTNQSKASYAAFLLLLVPFIWFILAQGAKRCHDRGNSGWYQLIPLYLLYMLFAEGEIGRNKYGLNPKGIGNSKDIGEIRENLS